jgi:hypothetical protein
MSVAIHLSFPTSTYITLYICVKFRYSKTHPQLSWLKLNLIIFLVFFRKTCGHLPESLHTGKRLVLRTSRIYKLTTLNICWSLRELKKHDVLQCSAWALCSQVISEMWVKSILLWAQWMTDQSFSYVSSPRI